MPKKKRLEDLENSNDAAFEDLLDKELDMSDIKPYG